MPDGVEHFTDLLIVSFVPSHFVPSVLVRRLEDLDIGGCGFVAVFENQSSPQFSYCPLGRHSFRFYLIDLRNSFRRSDSVREVAVVCQDDQSFGIEIKTADWME